MPHPTRSFASGQQHALAVALAALLLGACAAPTTPAPVVAAGTAPQLFVFGPYADLNQTLAPRPQASATGPSGAAPSGTGVLTWAFANGECGNERWGESPGQAVARASVTAFNQVGAPYIVSTGGGPGMFTCGTEAGMELFMARYDSASLRGIDFVIEADQTVPMLLSLVRQVRSAQMRRPHLRYSFTLETLAASDDSRAGLSQQGQWLMQALVDSGMTGYFINLKVMNYGDPKAAHCVVVAGQCDMAASARRAVQNFQARYALPFGQIEVTAMIGVNDVPSNVFSLRDARELARFVRYQKLGGLHFVSLDRDVPCAAGQSPASAPCHGLRDVASARFAQAFASVLN